MYVRLNAAQAGSATKQGAPDALSQKVVSSLSPSPRAPPPRRNCESCASFVEQVRAARRTPCGRR
eukprot:3759987-Pleurochrysis_carterae.AAC.1